MKHTIRRIMGVVRESPAGRLPAPAPPNRQLSRTETNMLVERVHGHTADRPSVLGNPNGADAIQVYATGLFEGVRKGAVSWVTGDKVDQGLRLGVIVEVGEVSPGSRVQMEQVAEHDRASARDHVASPPGAMFEPPVDPGEAPVDPGEAPVPTASDIDVALAELSKADLVKLARAVDLTGRTAMDKSELYEHLRKHPDIGDHVG